MGLQTDVHIFLIKHDDDAVLVDVGAPTTDFSVVLLAALYKALGSSTLRQVLLTHGHLDHVGA